MFLLYSIMSISGKEITLNDHILLKKDWYLINRLVEPLSPDSIFEQSYA